MDYLKIYTVGGDTLILAGGVAQEQIAPSCTEILKADVLHTQAACIISTQIQIPRAACAEDYFSADCALCFGAFLHEKNAEKAAFKLSVSGLNVPMRVVCNDAAQTAALSLAGKAKTLLSGSYEAVILGECGYFVAEKLSPEQAPTILQELLLASSLPRAALLVRQGDSIIPYYAQKSGAACGFSAGSAALALAFLESEQSRDYIKKTYRFPKGERRVDMKRYLSEAFEATLSAEVKILG